MVLIVFVAVVIAVIAAFFAQTLQAQKGGKQSSSSKKPDQPVDIPYSLRPQLFTPAEQKFYDALASAITPDQIVFGKVRVADVLQPASGISRAQWQSAFNRISAKHFDYVICDRATLSVQSVIELQDKSHNKSSRIERDQFLRKACKSAGLALVEFKARADYSIADIRAAL